MDEPTVMNTFYKTSLWALILLGANYLWASGPNISYIPVNCTQEGFTSLSANITDDDGINIASDSKPRLYYKKKSEDNTFAISNDHTANGWKYVEASNASSPFNFDFDFSKLTSSVNKNDTIQYFVIAENMNGETAWNSADFTVDPSNVNLDASHFPLSNVAHFFRTIKTYSGNYTLDPTGTQVDTNFLSLTKSGGFFEAINAGAVAGNITLTIRNSSLNEEGLHALNQWIEMNGCVQKDTLFSYKIKIKPFTSGIEISGKSADAIIKLNGADRVIIDGRNSENTSTPMLTLRNDSSAANTAVIHLISNGTNNGCEFDTIRYCNIIGGASQNVKSYRTFGIYANKNLATPSLNEGWGHNYNSFEKNNIKRVRYGIALAGDKDSLGKYNAILYNTIGPESEGMDAIGAIGIALSNQKNTLVRGNEVRTVGGDALNIADTADRAGIYLGTIQNELWNSQFAGGSALAKFRDVEVDGNHVHNIINQSGLSSVGIAYLNKIDNEVTNNQISNNMIHTIVANGNSVEGDHAAAIGLIGGNDDKVVFNSISITGDYDPENVGDMTNHAAGIRINSGTHSDPMISSLTLVNNIVNIDDAESNSGNIFFAISMADASNIWSSLGCDFNNFYANHNDIAGIGNTNTYTSYATVADFAPLQAQNSISANPQFESPTNLHLTAGSPCIEVGYEFPYLYYDFDGDIRPSQMPATIGADQFGKYFIWLGRVSNKTQNDLNWRGNKAPNYNGDDNIDIIIATENYTWTLENDFTLASLSMLNGTNINLNYNNIYAKGDINLEGSSRIYSGVGSCVQNYNVEDNGALILAGTKNQNISLDEDAWLCNLSVTSDSVTLLTDLNIYNDLIAKLSTTKFFQSSSSINVKGDMKLWGKMIYDNCASLNCALLKLNGTIMQYLDLRTTGASAGKISSLQIDKSASGNDSKVILAADLIIEKYLDFKSGKMISDGSNPLGSRYRSLSITNDESNAITRSGSATDDGFFQGYLSRKIGDAANYLFPVGIQDMAGKHEVSEAFYYTPTVIEVLDNSGNGNTIEVRFLDHDPDTANVGLIGRPYGDHTASIEDGAGNWVDVKGDFIWHVKYNGGGALPYNIQFAAPFMHAGNQDELADTPDELRVMKRTNWDGGNWEFQGTHAAAGTHAALSEFTQINSARRTGLSSFSGFSVGGNSGAGQALPVKMISLEAKPVDNKYIQLSWATAAEINNAGFEVQRSTDGEHFDAIAWVDGAGNSSEINHYSYNDEQAKQGIRYYYRLLQKDFDGNSEYSPLATAQLKENASVKWMQLIPNPASNAGSIAINISTETDAVISIFDIKGKEMASKTVKVFAGLNSIPLEIKALPQGNYIVSFTSNFETHSKQLIIK